MVQEKRAISQNHDTIDLHGITVAEALVIVKEIIKDESSAINQGKSLLFGLWLYSLIACHLLLFLFSILLSTSTDPFMSS